MAISSAIVKTKSESNEMVLQRLNEISSVSIETITPQGDIIIIVETDNLDNLHKTCVEVEKLDGVLGVYPCYVTTEDET